MRRFKVILKKYWILILMAVLAALGFYLGAGEIKKMWEYLKGFPNKLFGTAKDKVDQATLDLANAIKPTNQAPERSVTETARGAVADLIHSDARDRSLSDMEDAVRSWFK